MTRRLLAVGTTVLLAATLATVGVHSTRRAQADPFEPRVGSERAVADLVLTGARNNQNSPSVAWGVDEYLIAWEDRRGQDGRSDIWAARVDAEGSVLDGQGIPLVLLPDDQLDPAVAFDGANFLVVWWDEASGQIVGTRVGPDGGVLDPDGILISAGPGFQPAVAWSGSTYFVTWADARAGNSDVFGARVAADGVVVDPDGLFLWPHEKTLGVQEPSIGWNGAEYLIAWVDTSSYISDARAGRVTEDGLVLDEPPLTVARGGNTFVGNPSVAVGGTSSLSAIRPSRAFTGSRDPG